MTAGPHENWRDAKRPRWAVAGPYGRPLHPVLVPVPIGAWVASVVFDVASHAGGPAGALAVGSMWLLGVGVFVAYAAMVLGYLDLLQIPAGTAAMRTGIAHMGFVVTATTVFLGGFLVRWGFGPGPGAVPVGLIVLSAVGIVLLVVGGHLGGLLAYTYGVRVTDEARQRRGYGTVPDQGAP